MFMIVDSVLLQPLRYRDSGRLVAVWEQVQTLALGPIGPNPRHVDFWTKRSKTIESFALVQQASIGLSIPGADHPQLVGVVSASAELFNTLQVKPLLGHGFLPEQGLEARDSVAVLSYSLWQNSFGGDPQIIGKTVRLGEVSRQVVGVLPPQFHFPNRNALRAFQSKQTASHVPEPSIFVPLLLIGRDSAGTANMGTVRAISDDARTTACCKGCRKARRAPGRLVGIEATNCASIASSSDCAVCIRTPVRSRASATQFPYSPFQLNPFQSKATGRKWTAPARGWLFASIGRRGVHSGLGK